MKKNSHIFIIVIALLLVLGGISFITFRIGKAVSDGRKYSKDSHMSAGKPEEVSSSAVSKDDPTITTVPAPVPGVEYTDAERTTIDYDIYANLDASAFRHRLYEDNNILIKPYLNEDGALDNDMAILDESSALIFDFANELKNRGYLAGTTYCDESHSVAFFMNNGQCYLYIPRIAGTYSAADMKFNVVSVETLSLLDDVVIRGVDHITDFNGQGAVDAAQRVAGMLPDNYTHTEKTKSSFNSLSDIANWMASLQDDRTIFWRGHGNIYDDEVDGSVRRLTCFVTHIKENDTDNYTYVDNWEYDGGFKGVVFTDDNYYAITSNFWNEFLAYVDGGMFMSGSCETGNDGGHTALIFYEHGFDAYVAPSGSVFTIYSDNMVAMVAAYLSGQMDGIRHSLSAALAKSKEQLGEKDIWGVSFNCWEDENVPSFTLIPELEAALKAYKDFLSSMNYDYAFGLIYFDGDDIPELVVASPIEAHVNVPDVYGYRDGKLKQFEYAGCDYGTLIYSEKNSLTHHVVWINGYGEINEYHLYRGCEEEDTVKYKGQGDYEYVDPEDYGQYEFTGIYCTQLLERNSSNLKKLSKKNYKKLLIKGNK